mmetsp:Transcript_55475/g.99587  ORF Transcript_55475/g.99587 Transcript_55475/m.99587 type:complete len:489 (+) Transcript_55475:102-1568(+)
MNFGHGRTRPPSAAMRARSQNSMARWESDKYEAGRLQRLEKVRAAVQSHRPPRPQGVQVAQRVASASAPSGSSRKPRARSASCSSQGQVSRLAHGLQPSSCPPLEPEFMLSPGQRLKDAQDAILVDPAEAAAFKAEMQDWYFAYRTENAEAPERDYESLLKRFVDPADLPGGTRPRSRVGADSPYAKDLRMRPRSGLALNKPRGMSGKRRMHADVQAERVAAAEVRAATPAEVQPALEVTRDQRVRSAPAAAERAPEPKSNDTAPAPASESTVPSSAELMEWLNQANKRVEAAFAPLPSAASRQEAAKGPAETSSAAETSSPAHAPVETLSTAAREKPEESYSQDVVVERQEAAAEGSAEVAPAIAASTPAGNTTADDFYSDAEGASRLEEETPAVAADLDQTAQSRHTQSPRSASDSGSFDNEDFEEEGEDGSATEAESPSRTADASKVSDTSPSRSIRDKEALGGTTTSMSYEEEFDEDEESFEDE